MLKLYFGNMQLELILKSVQMLIGQTECFALKFANIVGKLMRKKLELLYEQFHEYKTIVDAKLPDEAYGEALLSGTSDGHRKECIVDVIWYYLQKVRSPVGPIICLSYCLKLHESF